MSDNIWDAIDATDDDEFDKEIARKVENYLQEVINDGRGAYKQREFDEKVRFEPKEYRSTEVEHMLWATAKTAQAFPNLSYELVAALSMSVFKRVHEALENGEFGWFN